VDARSGAGLAEVVSLSARQVEGLLRALELHHELLQAGHEDARNLLLRGLRPAYILDFELIYKYAFRAEERPDWASELQYLLDRQNIAFFIGPGTDIEIQKFIYSIGFIIDGEGNPIDLESDREDRGADDLDLETIRAGMARLARLLDYGNVTVLEHRMLDAEDEEAFAMAKLAMDLRRSKPDRATANWADASNWTAVLHLRRQDDSSYPDCYPYLLTATAPLLEEGIWSTASNAPVSRRPSDAIYTEILLETFPDPEEAMGHTMEMVFQAAALAKELKMSPAYLCPDDFRDDSELERALEDNLVGDELQQRLAGIAEFVNDPVVKEAQRIYDNARLVSANVARRRGVAPELLGGESPRKLFDLIVEVSAALNAGNGRTTLGDLWRTALDLTVARCEDRVSYELVERNAVRTPMNYLAAEHYPAVVGKQDCDEDGEQCVLRWPSALDGGAVVDAFSRAYGRHGVTFVKLVVGTERGIEKLQASLPITLDEIIEAVGAGGAEVSSSPVWWLRMGSPEFDLYADLSSSDLKREPLVGVFAAAVDPEHIEDLYFRTSSRYLLPAWLRRVLESIRDGENSR
jgi:hypothetical protein